ncbi:hypothetical protein JXL83_03285 [candidate division WOR-3 bacterium]|nr:hypothetical protein [candidate division WOR-3 bacterium]
MVTVLLSRITGGILLLFFGSWSVMLGQKESYKKPKILRKRLSKKEKILKEHFAYFAVVGALGWIVAETYRFFEYSGIAGIALTSVFCAANAAALFFRLKKTEDET